MWQSNAGLKGILVPYRKQLVMRLQTQQLSINFGWPKQYNEERMELAEKLNKATMIWKTSKLVDL